MNDELREIRIVSYEEQLKAIQNIRIEVFQKEQKVAPELEFDGLDAIARHLLAYVGNKPVGTLRIREIKPKIVKIERLAVLKPYRNRGISKQLMVAALDNIAIYGDRLVVVHAQEYIKKLYQQLGFEQVGGKFEEAGISHVKMTKQL
jgi:predicted GNAT family N-acyltransferase